MHRRLEALIPYLHLANTVEAKDAHVAAQMAVADRVALVAVIYQPVAVEIPLGLFFPSGLIAQVDGFPLVRRRGKSLSRRNSAQIVTG